MNYIFGNNTLLYSRASRGGNASSSHGSVGPKQKHWAKKGSSDELQAEPEPSRWQQIVAFFTRRHSFIDCISVATSSTQGLCVFLLNFLSCVAVEPLCKEEEYSVGDHCCPMCNPGYYVKQACSNWTGIVCAPCPPQTYTAHANGLSKCLSCGVCDPDMGLVTWRECSSREDTVCRCIPGYFCETQEGDHCSTCSPHTNCSLGQRVVERGNYFQDTVCADCPTGTFSPGGAQEECLPWTKCDAWHLKAEHGTSSTDATCSYSGLFYFVCFSLSGFILVVGAIFYVYVIRKRSHTRPAAREVEPLQRQEKDNTVKLPVLEVGPAEEETAFNRVSSG